MATATPYISGLKKPLNQLESPVYPDIKKGPPIFKWSRKWWQVDPGAVVRDTEPYTQFVEPAVLAQSRDYNKTVYGQSSHRDIVNAEFRPPMISYYEDIGPLTRVPATIQTIIPHVNPGTAGFDGGTSGYTAKNERSADVMSALTDRVKFGEWRPTFFAPLEVPMDNKVLPDLETKLPSISQHAGWSIPVFISPTIPETYIGEERLGKGGARMKAGYETGVRIDAPTPLQRYELGTTLPQISAGAGMNTPVLIDAPIPVEGYELGNNRPMVSVTAGTQVPIHLSFTPVEYDFSRNLPSIPVTAGYEFPMDISTPTPSQNYQLSRNLPSVPVTAGYEFPVDITTPTDPHHSLQYNRPQVSVTAGANIPITLNSKTPEIELETKIGKAPISGVLNAGSEDGFRAENTPALNEEEYITQKLPSYSYIIPGEEPVFRERNSTVTPHFRERLQPEKAYGNISQSSGTIPRSGVDEYLDLVSKRTTSRPSRNPYYSQKKKAVYRL